MLGNLLTNVAKFSPTGSVIRVVGRRLDSMAHVTVIDQGPGVAEDDRARIFDRFYRGTTPTSTRGTGIGLAIVQAGAARLGGSVELLETQPEEEPGARFLVRLPLADERASRPVVLL